MNECLIPNNLNLGFSRGILNIYLYDPLVKNTKGAIVKTAVSYIISILLTAR